MGDSTVMTIEFLRARLLSERSVSRTARQRADQLAQRVIELEEQLRVVSIQRKKAEKAAAEVLTILESQGVSDFSELSESSSNQDEVSDKIKDRVDNLKEDETSTALGTERTEMEDKLSGSELEVSPSQGRSLSWKSRSNSPDSIEKRSLKQMTQRQRRSRILSSAGSSPKHRGGKSCRKIKKGEMGYDVEEKKDKNNRLDVHISGEAAWCNLSDVQHDIHREASQNEFKKASAHARVEGSFDGERKENGAGLYANGFDRDEDMMRVLELRDQLIGQYEAEENAQREWEEKYNESKNSSLGFCDPGVQPALDEISSDPKDEVGELADKSTCDREEAKSSPETNSHPEELVVQKVFNLLVPATQRGSGNNLEKSGSSDKARAAVVLSGFVPNAVTSGGTSLNAQTNGSFFPQYYNPMAVKNSENRPQEFAFCTKECIHMIKNLNHNTGVPYEKSDTGSSSNSSSHANIYGLLDNQPYESPSSSHSGAQLSRRLSPAIQRQLHKLPEAPKSSLGSVLEALQHAKISLRQQLVAPLPSHQDTLPISVPTYSRIGAASLDVRGDSAALFRLPTDSFPKNTQSQSNFYGSRLSSTIPGPNVGYFIASNNHQYSRTSYLEAGPMVSVGKQYSDPYDIPAIGFRSSSDLSHPHSTLKAEAMHDQSGFSGAYLDPRNEMPSRDPYMHSGDGAWSDLRRL